MDQESVHPAPSEPLEETRSHVGPIEEVVKPQLPKELLEELAALATPEEKLERIVAFMQAALEGGGGHQFREFWDARRMCLDLFQVPINPIVRVHLWTRYNELCHEAKRVKELFEEQSTFVTEQIEKAIEAVAADFGELESKLASMPQIEAFLACTTVLPHLDRYQILQHELDYLNSFATRITSLRKEVVKTDMKHKHKTRLLSRLWALGDAVFPRRKQVIAEVSTLFVEDVNAFIQSTFVGELKMHELFSAREEIQHLQGVAKLLTLSTEAFTTTRLRLSECWDSIKTILIERKKERAEQRETFKKHKDELVAEVDKVKAGIEGKSLNAAQAHRLLQQTGSKMRSMPLSHHDVRQVREQIEEVEGLLGEAEEKRPFLTEHKSGRWKELVVQAEKLSETAEDMATLEEAFRTLEEEAAEENITKSERLELDHALSGVRGTIERLHEAHIVPTLTEEEMVAELSRLEQMRTDVRAQLETWRKASGGSGCDFSEALRYTELMEEERARLERIDELVARLEELLLHRQEEPSL
jgi:hypothetical protein